MVSKSWNTTRHPFLWHIWVNFITTSLRPSPGNHGVYREIIPFYGLNSYQLKLTHTYEIWYNITHVMCIRMIPHVHIEWPLICIPIYVVDMWWYTYMHMHSRCMFYDLFGMKWHLCLYLYVYIVLVGISPMTIDFTWILRSTLWPWEQCVTESLPCSIKQVKIQCG